MNNFQRMREQFSVYISFRIRRLAFQLGLLVMVAPVLAWSQIALVHVTTCGEQTFPSTCTIPATGSGNLIVVGFETDVSNTTTTISSITDNASDAYAEAGAARAVDASLLTVTDLWYAKNSVAGATTVTITPSSSINGVVVIWEFSGIDRISPLDQTAVLNSQPATTAVSGSTVTTTSASEVIISIADVSNSLTGITSGNAFTNDSTAFASGWAHLITSTTGTYAAQWIQNSAGTYDSSTASFKAASSGPNFTLSVSPTSQGVTAGGSAAYTVSVAPLGGFTGTVTLSASGQPSGTTATFSPSSINTSGSSTLTVSTLSSTPATSYPLNITGTSGSLTQTSLATVVVTSSTGSSSCDLNKDGSINAIDVQLAVNKYLSCTAVPNVSSTAFATVVVNGALGGSCSATTGAHTVFLNWTASPTGGVTYNVYRATSSGAYTTPSNSGITGTSFADCSVTPGQTYYYVVRAVDSSGNQSGNSPEVTAIIPSS